MRFLPLYLLLVALGCRRVEPGHGGVEIEDIVVDETLPTVLRVRWASDTQGTAAIQYSLDESFALGTPATTDPEITVLGLKAGKTYNLRVSFVDEAGVVTESAVRQVSLKAPPRDLPVLTVAETDPTQSIDGGFILTSILLTSSVFVVIIDQDGDYVWFWRAGEGLTVPTARISRDHKAILAGQSDYFQREDLGNVQRIDLRTGEELETRTYLLHHDFQELPDGNIAWLGLETRENIEVEGELHTVTADVVFETMEGTGEGGQVTERFNFFDDYLTDPWPTCQHYWDEAYNTGGFDWTHANSILYDDEADDFYLMSKNLDLLLKTDRQTHELIWQIHGLYSDFETEDATWSHGHMSQLWDGGFMVFDNGYHYKPPHSRVMEVAFDEDARTSHLVWDYWDPEQRFIPMLGDVRKLENGNYLACWTTAGFITEITPKGEVVWSATADLGAAIGRITWFKDMYSLQ